MPDYALRVKASNRVPLRNALVNLGIANWDGVTLTFNYGGNYDDIGPIVDWTNPPNFVMSGGEVLYHYNLRINLNLVPYIQNLASQGNATAQAIVASPAQYYAAVFGGQPVLPTIPKRVWL